MNSACNTSPKELLTIDKLVAAAQLFCAAQSNVYRTELYGVTDGKAIGTYVEHAFREFLMERYDTVAGNSASGLDLPSVNTDIKVTSIRQPQSSCPYRDSKQKIYGLGYHLLVFVYEKIDDNSTLEGTLNFLACTFVRAERTADFQTTTGLLQLLQNDANIDDVFAFLEDHRIPGDEVTLYRLAEDIIKTPPEIGYLTISNALQWRLQYKRIITQADGVDGIIPIIRYGK